MRLSAQEEYGLRCLLQVAAQHTEAPVRIPDVAAREGISPEYAAKLLRILRRGGLVTSVRGAGGGYLLARPADQITIWQAIEVLDGHPFDDAFCQSYTGRAQICMHSTGCSIRSLWRWMGDAMQHVLSQITLSDMERGEHLVARQLTLLSNGSAMPASPSETPA